MNEYIEKKSERKRDRCLKSIKCLWSVHFIYNVPSLHRNATKCCYAACGKAKWWTVPMKIECFARWQLHRVIVVYSTRRRFMISHLKFCIKYTRKFFFPLQFSFSLFFAIFFAVNNIILSNQISLENDISVSNYGSVSGLVIYLNTSISDHFYPLKPFIGFQVSHSYVVSVEIKNEVFFLYGIITISLHGNKTVCPINIFSKQKNIFYGFKSISCEKNAFFIFYIQSIISWVCLQLIYIYLNLSKKVQVFNPDEVFDQTAGILL